MSPRERAEVVVRIAQGKVCGVRHANIDTFFGIPFARPPVGQLRWRPPVELEPGQDAFDATSFGPDAMQRVARPTSRAIGMSEDCLRLNIWQPRCGGLRPVMVWIHGGSFIFGSASDALTDGSGFAERGAVFVSLGSRVGIFGFLAHPELIEESPFKSAGNYGLLDILAGLRWVKQNIEAFGGDPERITIFGVSSGAASIAMLMTSPLARNLFAQVILESPGSYRPLASLRTASEAGVKLGPLSLLRKASGTDILGMEPILVPAMRRLTAPRILRPILDGWILPLEERQAFEAGAFTPVPTMVGSNADEGSLLIASWPIDDVASWNKVIEENFGSSSARVRQLYPALRDEDARGAIADLFGDTQFSLAAREIASEVQRRQPKTYRYLFTRRRAGAPRGPDHADEHIYVFKSFEADGRPVDDRDRRLAASMQEAWFQFAATGSPGVVEDVDWVSVQHGILELGDRVCIRTRWREQQLDFIKHYVSSTNLTHA